MIINKGVEPNTLVKQLSTFTGLIFALIISIPLWLILAIVLVLM